MLLLRNPRRLSRFGSFQATKMSSCAYCIESHGLPRLCPNCVRDGKPCDARWEEGIKDEMH
jgi:hypothetical protein